VARKYLFVDEAGNFDFSPAGSHFFILTSIALDGCAVGDRLLELRRELIWEGITLTDAFHATTDTQAIRDRVFALLTQYDFRVDATIFEKRMTQPHLQSEDALYELAWYLHMRHVAPRVATRDYELMVVGASISTRKRREALGNAVAGVVSRTVHCATARTAYWPATSDPCLQVADYCCWAIQRKWERNDARSHVLIADKIRSEYPVFQRRTRRYY
jgi:hypothetical protein